MGPGEIKSLRQSLGMTQDHFAQILGVHTLTVSKWERGVLQPSPYHLALMQSFTRAARNEPGIGTKAVNLLVAAGIGYALFKLLEAAFEEEE